MEADAVYIVLVILFGGVAAYLINMAPFIEAQFKQIAIWVIIVLVVILVAMKLFPLIMGLFG